MNVVYHVIIVGKSIEWRMKWPVVTWKILYQHLPGDSLESHINPQCR